MHTNILKKFAACALGVLMLLGSIPVSAVTSNFLPCSVTAGDTISGYSTVLRTSRCTANETLVFRVVNPQNTVIEIPAETDAVGIAETDLYGFHTKYAGVYSVSAYYRDYSENQPISSFTVFPDSVSATISTVTLQSGSIPADGVETALLIVRLYDKNGNPVPGHQVKVVSSRTEDTVTEATPGARTNQSGEKVFEISSQTAGISYLTALDQESGTTLESRAKLIFFEPDSTGSSAGTYFGANLFGGGDTAAQPSGPVAGFKLQFTDGSGQENVAVVGKDQNYFTVTAVDASGIVVKNYTGTILIGVDNDPNATLPNDGQYTFRPQDEGSFEFALAFQFSQLGTQTIQVFAYDPDAGKVLRNIRGELQIKVQESADVDPDANPGGSSIEIKTPINGNKYATADISVSGKARPNVDLNIFLDGVEMSRASSDSDGVFFTTVLNVANGTHQLYVQEAAGMRDVSAVISFSVDTAPAALQSVQIYPDRAVASAENITVTALAEPGLDAVTARLDGTEHLLLEDRLKAGNYSASFAAPVVPGEYPVDITLVDKIGHESQFLSHARLVVEESAALLAAPTDVRLVPQIEAMAVSWSPVEKAALYVVSGGKYEFNMTELGSVPANKTGLLIDQLEAGTEYFFEVAAMDSSGNFSEASPAVSARPLFADGQSDKLQGEAGDTVVRLSWQRSAENPDYYMIRYGIRSREYLEQMPIPPGQNEALVPDLINGVTYYFTVVAVKDGRALGTAYGEIALTPLSTGFHPAAGETPYDLGGIPLNSGSGPEVGILFAGLSFLFGAAWWFLRLYRRPRFALRRFQ